MIEVNLLPAEMRRVEHTPLPRFLVILVGTAAVMATGAFGVVVNWRQVPDLEDKAAVVRADVRKSEKSAAKHDELLESIAETKDRKRTISELWHARIPWSMKWAQLSEMTPRFVGLTDMKLEEPRRSGRGDENGGLLTFETLIAGDRLDRVSNFRRVLKGEVAAKGGDVLVGKKFFESFQDLLPTGAKKVEVRDYVEKVALDLKVKMPLKPTSVRLSEALKALREEQRQKRVGERGKRKTVPRRPKSGTPVEKAKIAPLQPVPEDDEEKPAAEIPAAPAPKNVAKPLPKDLSTRGAIKNLNAIRAQVQAMKTVKPEKTEVTENKQDTE